MSHFEGVQKHFAEHTAVIAASAAALEAEIDAYIEVALGTLRAGGTIFWCGNGGSAADAQHLAAELVVRFARARSAAAAIALTTDTSVLTAGGNDLGFDQIFARQVEALGRQGDLLVLHSTSGQSANLLAAAEAAKRSGMHTVGVLGRGGGALAERVDVAVTVPTDSTARAQEVHLLIGHIVCDAIDRALAESQT